MFDFASDTLTKTLVSDDKVLKPILTSLYYPQCPYEFSVLPVEILGQVYEQFLGKVIRLTPAHRAKVEEKPEVKKAGGVYYTPSYIVDYIVQQTVGQRIEGQTPEQISKLRILDPACGSGSFLLGAYQYLLDYHRQWYENNGLAKCARRKQPAVYQDSSGGWRLTGAEKKRILLNNIYGVDIDRQAVEVTKLSPLRQLLAEGNHLAEIVHFGDQQVFAGASTYTCLLFLDKQGNPQFHYAKAHDLDGWRASGKAVEGEVKASKATDKAWNFVVGPGAPLFERLSKMPVKLGDLATRMYQGSITSADTVFLFKEYRNETKGVADVYSKN